MRPARTASQLLEQLDNEFAWRLTEIASLRKAIRNAGGPTQVALLRASVTLLYAHWEGYVKTAAIRYGAYISSLRINFSEAQRSFSGLKALSYVKQLHSLKKQIFVSSELLSALHSVDDDRLSLNLDAHIANVGNLDYDLFEQIAQFLCIDAKSYSAKKTLIDESLLKKRNEIARGDYLLIDMDGFEVLSDEILEIMRQFKTDIQNAVALKAYLRPPALKHEKGCAGASA